VYVETGAWYDGWETRRHNQEPFDWVIIRLGVASGHIEGFEVDTAFFSGNHAPEVSIDACFCTNDDEPVAWGGGKGEWECVLGLQECGPSQRFAWKLDQPPQTPFTHVRLNMYPDGGIARFRVFGHAVPVFPADKDELFDLAAAQNGGIATACSDEHFGTRANLLLPGRGKDMGDGWETARSRGNDHEDWVVVRLGAKAKIEKVVVDTAHFRGNFPRGVRIEAGCWEEDDPRGLKDEEGWTTILEEQKCAADKEHLFEKDVLKDVEGRGYTHVKMVILPDGGVKRLRVFGKRHV
jgi:allantoicase